MISKHLNKNNLHHAYLIEGNRDEIVPEILKFCEDLKIKIVGNPDVSHISIDNFKIEDARNLKSYTTEKSFSSSKKIFIISANNFLLEAQNSLLKIFEEPIENTHFFVIVPDSNSLLKTLVSRFYLIREKTPTEIRNAEKFINMSLKDRIDFVKELLAESEEENEEGNEIVTLDSSRSKALKFLNTLEFFLHRQSVSKKHFDISYIEHFFKVREFLRMPGSSAKTLMESVALIIPVLKN
ncbi:hypothetical protein EXS45_00300 [Candidatus Nomurabacteria bacterium]|nr:hypothetical protein [Candidatus Nomurabacteria bacterium]